jgi:predicted hydrocarbon binding protein
LKDPTDLPAGGQGTRRIQAVVALRLLEVMRDRDLPGEILEDEDPTRTMPRRFGLSDVVERQIRAYKADVRKRMRLTDAEVGDLFRLVIRRPDGDEIFEQAGRLLAEADRPRRLGRVLPKRAQFALARSAAKRRLKKLFGRVIGGFGRGPFVIEGRSLFFIRQDPGGDACHLLSGFCKEVIEQTLGGTVRVDHTQCQSRGDELCRWQAEVVEVSASMVGPTVSPEAEAGA